MHLTLLALALATLLVASSAYPYHLQPGMARAQQQNYYREPFTAGMQSK